MPKINQKEYDILKGLDDEWKWIVRDENGKLYKFLEKPRKVNDFNWKDPENTWLRMDGDNFQFIQWEDEEPYNIQELIDEYLDDEYGYFNMKLSREFEEFIKKESEETEVKNIEWLKKELNTIKEEAQEILDEYDNRGPIVYRFEERLHSVNVFRNLLDQLDEPETLSEDWIYEKAIDTHVDTANGEIQVTFILDDLQNLLVTKQELPVVPTWFDKWWKDVYKGEGNLLRNIDMFHDKLYSSGTREMYDYISSPDNKQKLLNIIVNELDYAIEEEQKYIVSDNSSIPLLIKNDSGEVVSYDSQIAYNSSNGTIELTEQEIKDYDERYMAFAVKVEELEE